MNEFPERVHRLKDVSDVAYGNQARAELIGDVWLRQMLPAAEWEKLRYTPTFLLKELYPDVWLLGPNATEFKVFWRHLRKLLLSDVDAARFAQFQQDVLDTYKDHDITGTYESRRYDYFDVRHTYAWGKILQMGWISNKVQEQLFGPILNKVEDDGFIKRTFAGGLGLMTLVIISQQIPTRVDARKWADLRQKHNQFCVRWGLPQLSSEITVQHADA